MSIHHSLRLIVLFSILFLLNGCSKKITQFNIYLNSEATIPASTALNLPFSIQTPEIESSSESQLANNNSKADYVESMQLTNLTLTISSPDNETFSFLNSVKLFIQAGNLPEIALAEKTNIPNSIGNSIVCDVSKTELKEYIQESSLKIRVEAVTDELITEDVKLSIESTFFVDAKLIK